jgi:recombination protein RecT
MAGALTRLGQNVDAAKAASPEPDEELTLSSLIQRQHAEIAKALPATVKLTPEALGRIALTVIKADGKLASASPRSMLAALMVTAQLGLEPGPLGHVYFSPRWNNQTKGYEVQFTLGYKGIIELARRSGEITKIEARTVYAGDQLDVEYGLTPTLRHVPTMSDRGDAIAYYMIAWFRNGETFFHVMSKADVEHHRSRSDMGKINKGPWATDYDAMARKTCIRSAMPYLPLTRESAEVMAQAINVDDTVRTSFDPDELNKPRPVIDTVALEEGPADGPEESDAGAGVGPADQGEPGDRGGEPDRVDEAAARPDRTQAGVIDVGEAPVGPTGDDNGAGGAARFDLTPPDTVPSLEEWLVSLPLEHLAALAEHYDAKAPRTKAAKDLAPLAAALKAVGVDV